MRIPGLCIVAEVAAATLCCSELSPASSYVDPRLLDVPWGNYSFIRQAWRGYLETLPATVYLNGLGIVWGQSIPGKSDDEMAAALAWAGFKRVRFEIPWGSVRWDETGFDAPTSARLSRILPAMRKYGLRPLILLNANHLQPCPVRLIDVEVGGDAPAGARSLPLSKAFSGPPSFPATVMSLADGGTPGPLIKRYAVIADVPTIELTKPLRRAVKRGEVLRIAVLHYLPLYPVGTPQFERTTDGWLRYVGLVARAVHDLYGSDDYDVEIWNELTFGSAFLDINNYLEPATGFGELPDFLHPGGRAWELANRTVRILKAEHAATKVFWGFSNTTFFHTPVDKLPPSLDGQSYHPYGTGKRCYRDIIRNREKLLLDGYVPDECAVQPEGYTHTWQQTESLTRLIAPAVRGQHPPGSASFQHYMTEHGFAPAETGIKDKQAAQRAKEKFLLRAPLFWLNKGISALYVYDAYEPDDTGLGTFNSAGDISAGMYALHRLTERFTGATRIDQPRELSFQLRRDRGDVGVLPGDPSGRHLPQRDMVALLPFQIDAKKFIIAAYVMTQDFPRDLAPQLYHLLITGVNGSIANVTLYDPIEDSVNRAAVETRKADALSITLGVTDAPQLIEIEELP